MLSRLRLGLLTGRGIGLYPPHGDATEDSMLCTAASDDPVGFSTLVRGPGGRSAMEFGGFLGWSPGRHARTVLIVECYEIIGAPNTRVIS